MTFLFFRSLARFVNAVLVKFYKFDVPRYILIVVKIFGKRQALQPLHVYNVTPHPLRNYKFYSGIKICRSRKDRETPVKLLYLVFVTFIRAKSLIDSFDLSLIIKMTLCKLISAS